MTSIWATFSFVDAAGWPNEPCHFNPSLVRMGWAARLSIVEEQIRQAIARGLAPRGILLMHPHGLLPGGSQSFLQIETLRRLVPSLYHTLPDLHAAIGRLQRLCLCYAYRGPVDEQMTKLPKHALVAAVRDEILDRNGRVVYDGHIIDGAKSATPESGRGVVMSIIDDHNPRYLTGPEVVPGVPHLADRTSFTVCGIRQPNGGVDGGVFDPEDRITARDRIHPDCLPLSEVTGERLCQDARQHTVDVRRRRHRWNRLVELGFSPVFPIEQLARGWAANMGDLDGWRTSITVPVAEQAPDAPPGPPSPPADPTPSEPAPVTT